MSDNRTGVAGHTGTRNKQVGNVENYLKPNKGDLGQWGHLFFLKVKHQQSLMNQVSLRRLNLFCSENDADTLNG